jgi:hypothetical protein
MNAKCFTFKSPQSGSNQRPTDYKSVALPAELWRPLFFCDSRLLFRYHGAKVDETTIQRNT